jgi:protein TonB
VTRPAIAELVFAAAAPPPTRRHQALIVTALVHLGLAAAILGAQPTLETWSAEMAARVHDELTRIQLAEVETLPPPEPPPAEPPPAETPAEPPPAAAPAAPAADPPRSAPARPSPARAARVVASPPGALDLTGDVVVAGHASAYAGGVTSSTGASTRPVHQASRDPSPPAPAPHGVERPPAQRDRSRAVSLAGDEWNCPWPDAAEGLAIDEQVAVIRVRVAVDGAVESAEVVSDPGNGFGPAALSCARRTRFSPALDAEGRPIAARSPPIRVHFHRDR